MELRAFLLLPLCFPGLQAQTPNAEERRLEGSTLYIDCPYTAQTEYQQKKAWCRVRDDECEALVETTNPTPYPYTNKATKGNVTIVDDCLYKSVSITMTNLQAEDSGTYSCAHRSNNNWYIPLRTISLTVFKELHKRESESLSVQCPYGTLGHSTVTKYWCRRENQTWCKEVARTDNPSTQNNSQALAGRTWIQDDTQNRTVTITMHNLQARDSGVYQCAFYRGSLLIPIMEFKLSVSNGLQAQTPNAEERRLEGSTLYIDCPYTAQTGYWQKKAWCRMRDGKCEPLVETTGGPPQYPYTNKATKGNVTIVDNHQYRTVSITMTNLQAEDSGTYSCAHRSNNNWYIPLRTISLTVFKELHKRESESLSVQCPYGTLGHSTVTKYWCRRESQTWCKEVVRTSYPSTRSNSQALAGRTRIQDDTQNRTVTITMHNLQARDSGVYQCAFYRGSLLIPIMEFKLSVSNVSAQTTSSGTARPSQATPSGNSPPPSSNVHTFRILSGILSILFILSLISSITLCVRQRKQLKRRSNRQAEDIYDKPEDTAQLDRTERTESPKNETEDLQYVTLNHKSQLSPEAPLYCNIEPSQAHTKPKDEDVEYAVVALKQLPTNEKG
ncbi:polymeric immunoglobulin receptor-like [Numenius arquata]|uniref:polymeric immunoglobulin receptor-like n=1 Tax=Numenius arquata TaxID=31919 RepID=UPI003D3051D0